MPEYTREEVRGNYPLVTGQDVPNAWDLFIEIADAKVRSDGFTNDATRILAACYYIAYLASTATTDSDGRYTSVSKSIGNVSMSVSLSHGKAPANVWLDRYNELITNNANKNIGGGRVKFSPPATGYRDNVTHRRILRWWPNGRL